MDQQLEEIEENFKKASDLLRVKAFVKHLKQENMDADVLQLIDTTYDSIKRLKTIAKDIDKLHNMQELNVQEHNQLYLLEEMMSDMLIEIPEEIKKMESKTNLLARKSVTLSVMEDLDSATSTFKETFILSDGRYELRTLKRKK